MLWLPVSDDTAALFMDALLSLHAAALVHGLASDDTAGYSDIIAYVIVCMCASVCRSSMDETDDSKRKTMVHEASLPPLDC